MPNSDIPEADLYNLLIKPSPEDLEEESALAQALTPFQARLIKAQGVVAVSLSGAVRLNHTEIPYRLIPNQGTLAKTSKWRKLAKDAKLELIKSRVNVTTVGEFHQLVQSFVVKAALLAQKDEIDPARYWSALVKEQEVCSRQFQLIESRILAAGERRREANKAELIKSSVKLSQYPESFELAHDMPRRFIAVLGPTNSGKTHKAMEALRSARSGVYLAPLRLLALENFERLSEQGVNVSLVTGEERRLSPGATHTASTIEMLDTKTPVDVAVIDEIQMLEDPHRGAAWTAAVCGVPAQTVYLVGSVAARPALVALAGRLGCPIEFELLERKSPLTMEDQPINDVSRLRKGDAIIAFSRRNVLAWRDQLIERGFSVATIYGNLSPEVRRAQAKRFRDGEADLVVATDSIGMGLNLPVSRVVFSTAVKFDGFDEDVLPAWLAQQIAGRAGRYGLHEAGFVAGFDIATHRRIKSLLKAAIPPLNGTGFLVAPTLDHLAKISEASGETQLEKLLKLFAKNIDVNDEFFVPTNLAEQVERAAWLDTLPLPLEHRFMLSLVPISTRVAKLQGAWESWAKALSQKRTSYLEAERHQKAANPLQAAEDACQKYSAYAWLSNRLPEFFPDGVAAQELAHHTSEHIDYLLQQQNARKRSGKKGKRK